ncbi:nitronate monooxygenase [Peribacillus deserti]|uniref:Probable nitronate monooxygenase n=1 Tax=Peribacillus deserti TaxID=673318 RepID=A0ABS2QK59_9BACI|nr:nitronate monooxygenase family protein [Peribacillus deserti]MBM7693390.1 nitronate monooxygenase [Peribacillus deserti]
MNIKTPVCHTLGIQFPIFQAGMAGGPATPALAAEVSEAGGLGSLGGAYMKPEEIRSAVREIKQRTSKPFAVNLFCADLKDNLYNSERVNKVLNSFRKQLGIPEIHNRSKLIDLFEEQFQVLLEEEVPIISTAFGILPLEKMKAVHEKGKKVIVMVTTVNEAKRAEQRGVDIIVAQGSDAGGHRSTFDMDHHPDGANIGTFSLVPQITDKVNIPVVAAGGIMDGRGLAAALSLGAQGVQMGTAFLCCTESGAHPAYQKAILNSTEESTVITKSFSGRPARGIKNAFIEEFERQGTVPLPFPAQNTLTADIRREAARQHNDQYMSLWAGQATRLIKNGKGARDIILETVDEAEKVLRNLLKLRD